MTNGEIEKQNREQCLNINQWGTYKKRIRNKKEKDEEVKRGIVRIPRNKWRGIKIRQKGEPSELHEIQI